MTEGFLDNSSWPDPHRNPNPYVPKSLGELLDYLTLFLNGVPGFIDKSGVFEDENVDTCFARFYEGLEFVRKKLGEERYAAVVNLATRAKALYLEDPDDTNGKTDQGVKLIHKIDEILTAARARRVKEKLPDEEGEISGD